jgi:hypothetical protein
MLAFCAAGVSGTGSGNVLGVAPDVSPHVTGSLRCTPRGSKVTMSKSSRSWGGQNIQLVYEVINRRDSGTARIDGQRPDPTSRSISHMPFHGDTNGGSLRVAVVQRNDQGSTLQVAVAWCSGDRRPGQRGLRCCRCRWGRRCRWLHRRGGRIGGVRCGTHGTSCTTTGGERQGQAYPGGDTSQACRAIEPLRHSMRDPSHHASAPRSQQGQRQRSPTTP